MKAITLRNISPEILKIIERQATVTKSSINKTILRLLEEELDPKNSKKKLKYHDLDHLAGQWSKPEAKEFNQALQKQRRLDKELWKTE